MVKAKIRGTDVVGLCLACLLNDLYLSASSFLQAGFTGTRENPVAAGSCLPAITIISSLMYCMYELDRNLPTFNSILECLHVNGMGFVCCISMLKMTGNMMSGYMIYE